MNEKEYLSQAHGLIQRIEQNFELRDMLWKIMTSVRSPSFEENLNTMPNTEAPYMKNLFKAMDLQSAVYDQTFTWIELTAQMLASI